MKKQLLIIGFTLLCISASAVDAQLKNWNTLLPLKSTRSEVEAILGKPQKHFDTYGLYDTEIGRFSVWFSDGKCLKNREGLQYRVKANLFTSLWFTPKVKRPLSEYEADRNALIRTPDPRNDRWLFYARPGDVSAYEVYIEKDGTEIVDTIQIRPTKEKEKLLCKF